MTSMATVGLKRTPRFNRNSFHSNRGGRCSSWGRIGRQRKARPDGRNPPLLTRIHYDLARLFLEGAQAGWSPTSQKTRPDSTSDAIRFSRPANDATRFTTSFRARITCRVDGWRVTPFGSNHRSVGGSHPAVPALHFAQLRSSENQAKRPGSSLGAD